MRILDATNREFADELQQLRRKVEVSSLLQSAGEQLQTVRSVLDQVRRRGDAALHELTRKYDGVDLSGAGVRVAVEQLKAAHGQLDKTLLSAVREAIYNVQSYQRHILVQQGESLSAKGVTLTTRYRPLERVGVCVPGAAAPLVSSLIMCAVPAQAAGVTQLAVVCPPRFEGKVHPAIMAVCCELGIEELYSVGGAQAVAALAYGTETIRPVDKIVGPGNIYVQLAKKEVFGQVDIDSFAGPSEIVVLADETADATVVACDLMGQAEHDPGSGILVTTSNDLAGAVLKALETELARSPRGEQTRRCLDEYGAIITAQSLDQAIDVVNQLAPEHLSVQTVRAAQTAQRCTNAGAIFVGPWTSEATGDYVAGPSHVLPTGGTARFFSPLSSMDFVRHSSVIEYDRSALERHWPVIQALADMEGLPAHARSVQVRLERSTP